MVAFNNIPGNILTPFYFAEFNSGGTPYETQARVLLVGPKLAAGSAPAGVAYGPIQSGIEADQLFGVGSVLSFMFRIARANAPFQPIWALPLADPAGNAASGSVTFTAPGVTGAGVFHVLGRRLTFQINAADTAATISANFTAAFNALGLPITAAVDGTTAAKTNLTFKHVGALGNGVEVERATDEPNALAAANATIVGLAGGTGVPDLVAPLANLGDDEFDYIAGPYADTNSLNATRDFLSDSNGRWSPTQQLYGHYFTGFVGNLSAQVTLGAGRNDQHASIMAIPSSPTPVWEWAAAYAALASAHLSDAPEVSRPLQTLQLNGVLPPRDRASWWDIADRQALYADGMSAFKVRVDGIVAVDRVTTTYRLAAGGVADATFRDVETMFQGMFALRYFRTAVTNKHSRQALADDNPANLPEIATPKDVRDTLVHAYNDLVFLGVAEKPEIFAKYVVVERDPNNATRLNAAAPLDMVNQLRIFAANVTAFLQFQTASGAVAI